MFPTINKGNNSYKKTHIISESNQECANGLFICTSNLLPCSCKMDTVGNINWFSSLVLEFPVEYKQNKCIDNKKCTVIHLSCYSYCIIY